MAVDAANPKYCVEDGSTPGIGSPGEHGHINPRSVVVVVRVYAKGVDGNHVDSELFSAIEEKPSLSVQLIILGDAFDLIIPSYAARVTVII